MKYKLSDIQWAYDDNENLQMYIHNIDGSRVMNLLTDFVYKGSIEFAYFKEFNNNCVESMDTVKLLNKYPSEFELVFEDELKQFKEDSQEILDEEHKKNPKGHNKQNVSDIYSKMQCLQAIAKHAYADETKLFYLYSTLKNNIAAELASREPNPRAF